MAIVQIDTEELLTLRGVIDGMLKKAGKKPASSSRRVKRKPQFSVTGWKKPEHLKTKNQ